MSMDCMGKLVWAKHNEIQQTNVKTAMGTLEYLFFRFLFIICSSILIFTL
jgi:hypothetical protein